MKYIKQLLIILAVCFAGELLAYFIPAPIPASIYGMLLLFLLLLFKVLRVEQIEELSTFFASVMPIFFISSSVKLMTAWDQLLGRIVIILVMLVLSTIVTTVVTGRTSQWIIRKQKSKKENQQKGDAPYEC